MKKPRASAWSRSMARSLAAMGRQAMKAGSTVLGQAIGQSLGRSAGQAVRKARKPAVARKRAAAKLAATPGSWTTGLAMGPAGARRYRLYTPPGLQPAERLPLLVMLHGCNQDADGFAASTHMNRLAVRARFLVLYPEQDRLANAQGCWNWYDTDHGRAQAEADLVLQAIDQVCRLRRGDRQRVVVAGLSAGAGLAALLAVRHPARLCGVVMHSGVPPGTAHSTLTALGAMRGRRATAPLGVASWPPLLVIHGSLDAVVSPRNGDAAAQAWALAAGATASPPRRVQRGQRHAMLVTDFKRRGRTAATLALVQGLGHAWSGGTASLPFGDPKGPDASGLVWAFAQKQFARRSAAP
jgi:poly(hydroxyalkanoate) depolymerase family esterase